MAMNEPIGGWGRKQVSGVVQAIVRAIGVALGLFLLALAVPLFFLPIPLGLPLALFALLLLAGTSKTAHRLITDWLKRHPGVWNRVKHVFDRFHKDES